MKNTLLTFAFSFIVSLSFSQQTVLTSGNNSQSSTGKVTYSVGLIHYKDSSGTGGSSSAGTQIPFEVLETLSLDEQNLVTIKLFPNPAKDFVFISLKQLQELDFQLLDISGRKISEGKINALQTKVNLTELKTSIYILNIYKDNAIYESYKIIKK